MKMKLYLSGRISGTDDYLERFAAAEEALTAAGYKTVNPTKAPNVENMSWEDALFLDFGLIRGCDGVAFLPIWEESYGARIEKLYAEKLGKKARRLATWLRLSRMESLAPARCTAKNPYQLIRKG